MSKKEEIKNEATEKVVTKYDMKKARRELEKKKEQREKSMTTGVTIVVLVAIVGLVLMAPINTWRTLHGAFIEVGGEKITQVDFDYYYNVTKNNYISQNSTLLSYFGIDTSSDFTGQVYDGELTWKDYFEEMTIDTIKQSKALVQDAQRNGFSYNTDEDYETYSTNLAASAQNSGVSENEYLSSVFGQYATKDRLEAVIRESLFVSAYNDVLMENNKPTDDEVESYYQENKVTYDSVDYHYLKVEAELPTEPTELADEGATVGEDGSYTPSEEETFKAMEDAEKIANEKEATVATEGEEVLCARKTSCDVIIRDWLFDDERVPGDTATLEDEEMHCYFVVSFEKKYRDESKTANVRLIAVEGGAQAVVDEYNEKGATEDVFIQLYDEKSVADYGEGGLFTNVTTSTLSDSFNEWIFEEERKPGDVGIISFTETAEFVVYYIGEGDPLYYSEIVDTMVNDRVDTYINDLMATMELKDKGNLNYVKVKAKQAAETEESVEVVPAE